MKKIFLLLLAFVLASCASTIDRSAPVTIADEQLTVNQYINEDVGVSFSPSDKWTLVTKREGSPDYFVEYLPEDKGPNESPLFLGYDKNEMAFFRCTLEYLGEDLQLSISEYFRLLYSVNEAELNSVKRVEISDNPEAIQWEYTTKFDGVTIGFYETVFFSNEYAVRLSLWTSDAFVASYRQKFEDLTGTILLLGENGWSKEFENLSKKLTPAGTDIIDIEMDDMKVAAEVTCPNGAENLLWKLDNTDPPIYIFGSIHFGLPDFYPFNDTIENAVASSKHLVVEANTISEEFQTTVAKLQLAGRLPEGQVLKDVISEELYNKTEARFKTFGMPFEPFTIYKPWMLAMVLQSFQFQSLGYSQDAGVDVYFLENALKREMSILEIEDPMATMDMLNSIDGELFLAYTLLSMETMDHQALTLIKAWKCGDIEKLNRMLLTGHVEQMPALKDVNEVVFNQRNELMAQQIIKYANEKKSCFIVVGAGHLVGNKSIFHFLESEGYTATRVD